MDQTTLHGAKRRPRADGLPPRRPHDAHSPRTPGLVATQAQLRDGSTIEAWRRAAVQGSGPRYGSGYDAVDTRAAERWLVPLGEHEKSTIPEAAEAVRRDMHMDMDMDMDIDMAHDTIPEAAEAVRRHPAW